jgi:hypothetical protein
MRRIPLFVAALLVPACAGSAAPSQRVAAPISVAVAAPATAAAPVAIADDDGPAKPPPAPTADAARARALEVVAALKAKDMGALAALVDPDEGVRFTPYSYVDAQADVLLHADELRRAANDPTVRRWGSFDGSGTPIDMTFAQYYARFVFDVDFTKATDRPVDFGENTQDNAAEVYGPSARIVELYWPGDQNAGMDWRALRVVLEPKKGVYYVVGIVHAEWTI